jgi:predicted RNA binding protein YcfA (HicA-like mRNA interferase family)
MTRAQKLLARMRNNPRDWSIEDLKALAERCGIDWRQPGTSHVTFSHPRATAVTVPAHKPIKPIYIKRFLQLLDDLGYGHDT